MKLRFCLACFLLISCRGGIAQVNLIQNGSFEELISCPNLTANSSTIEFAVGWVNPISEDITSYNSPDLFNQCNSDPSLSIPSNWYGFQIPSNGNGYAGIFASVINDNRKEFIQNELTIELKSHCKYTVAFDFSYGSAGCYKSSDFYFVFTKNKIKILNNQLFYLGHYFNINPDSATIVSFPEIINADTINWFHIEKEFFTNETASYLTIGNIKDTTETHMEFGWPSSSGGINNFMLCMIDNITLFQLDSSYCTTSIENVKAIDEILLYPNPSNTSLTIQSSAIKPGNLLFLNDLSGRLIQKIALHESENFQLNTQHLANGTYWLSILSSDGKQQRERFIVMHE